jgi:hypothetical protein
MDASSASWLLIALALMAANLPFINEAVFGFIPLKRAPAGEARNKHAWLRVLELALLYGVVGVLAWALEAKIGNVFVQTWEFYAITACLFAVLAFPGFVWRYLRKHRR